MTTKLPTYRFLRCGETLVRGDQYRELNALDAWLDLEPSLFGAPAIIAGKYRRPCGDPSQPSLPASVLRLLDLIQTDRPTVLARIPADSTYEQDCARVAEIERLCADLRAMADRALAFEQ